MKETGRRISKSVPNERQISDLSRQTSFDRCAVGGFVLLKKDGFIELSILESYHKVSYQHLNKILCFWWPLDRNSSMPAENTLFPTNNSQQTCEKSNIF